MTSNDTSTEHSLRRQLNWIDAAAIFVGIIIGSGIFVAPAQVIAAAGSMRVAICFWAVGGLIVACGAFCYAECGARLPRDGGFFNAFRVALGSGAAFVGGWAVALVIYPAAHAAIAYIFASYLAELVPAFSGHETWVAVTAVGSLNGSFLVCSRLIQTMSADGFFFSSLGKLDGRGVPLRAVLMIAAATAVYVVTASFDFLLGLFSFVIWIIYALSAVSLLILRRRRVGEPVRFRAPLGIVPPAMVMVAAVVMTAGTIIDAPWRALIGAGMLVLIACIYLLWRRVLPDSNPRP
jgi:amino acid transporter